MAEPSSEEIELLDPDEAIRWLRRRGVARTRATLAAWRTAARPGGPPFRRLAGRVFYSVSDLEQWVRGVRQVPGTP